MSALLSDAELRTKRDDMGGAGEIEFGSSWVAVAPPDNSMHARGDLQDTLATDVMVTLRGATNTLSGTALLVAPGTPHAIDATGVITLLIIEPHRKSPISLPGLIYGEWRS